MRKYIINILSILSFIILFILNLDIIGSGFMLSNDKATDEGEIKCWSAAHFHLGRQYIRCDTCQMQNNYHYENESSSCS